MVSKLLLTAAAALVAGAAAADTARYIVRLRDGDALAYARTFLLPQLAALTAAATGDSSAAAFVAREYARLEGLAFNGFAAELSPSAVAYLRALPIIDVLEPDTLMHGVEAPRRAQAASPTPIPVRGEFDQPSPPWHLDRVDERAHTVSREYSYTNTGDGVDVYILDSGINIGHADFAGRIAPGANFAEDIGPDDVTDCNGHGTHVAGLAAGTTFGIAKRAVVVPVRVYDCSNAGPVSQALSGINWAISRMRRVGRRAVVNMSFGGDRTRSLDDAVAALVRAGAVVVVAAGNEGEDACSTSPAGASESFAVAASDINDRFASFSNYGNCVSIVAPGRDITSAWIGGADATNTISGTSMASPIVAGAAAAYLQTHGGASVSKVRDDLACSGTKDELSGLPSRSTPDLLVYVPPAGFVPDRGCVTSGASAAALAGPVAALAMAVVMWSTAMLRGKSED